MTNSGPGALELFCHEVTVRFVEKAIVPPYEGSMIRGAFGRAFKESCCAFPHNGAGCPLGERCPYGYVFETSPPEEARDFARNKEVSPEAPPFAALVQGLLIRLPMLSAVLCGEVWREDFRDLVGRAGAVETVQDETTWASFRRHSSFKNRTGTLEGIVGRVEYAGPLEEFLPLLVMGGLAHVGKRAVFGLGRYRITRPDVPLPLPKVLRASSKWERIEYPKAEKVQEGIQQNAE
ncbi:hypothetical protein BH18ACT11_BH18ACT11_19990 [soil metagenome]